MKKRKTPQGDGNIVALVCLKQCGEVHEQNKTPEGDGNHDIHLIPSGVFSSSMKKRKTPRGDGNTGSEGSEGSSGFKVCMWNPDRGR